jgi:hypothetical protein
MSSKKFDGDLEEITDRLAHGISEIFSAPGDPDVVVYEPTDGVDAQVVLGDEHGEVMFMVEMMIRELTDDEVKAHLSDFRDQYDERFAGYYGQTVEMFRANLMAGYIYLEYTPYEGGPGWENRQKIKEAHDAWEAEKEKEDEIALKLNLEAFTNPGGDDE